MSMRTPKDHALQKIAVVLVGQNGDRRDDRHLLAILHRLERRAHRHFRLPESHIPAHEAIHRMRILHIALDVLDRLRCPGVSW
jgi:hypothetical protein